MPRGGAALRRPELARVLRGASLFDFNSDLQKARDEDAATCVPNAFEEHDAVRSSERTELGRRPRALTRA